METTPRPHHKDPKPDRVFRHAVTATFAVAMQAGIKDWFAASHRPCHTIHDDTIKADTTQAAIQAAVPACASYRATSLLLRNGCTGGSDMVETERGRSRKSGADAGSGRGRKRGGAAKAAAGPLPPLLRRAQAGRNSMAPPPLRLGGRLSAAGDVADPTCDAPPLCRAAPHSGLRLKHGGSVHYTVGQWYNQVHGFDMGQSHRCPPDPDAARLRGAPPVQERPSGRDGRWRSMMAPQVGCARLRGLAATKDAAYKGWSSYPRMETTAGGNGTGGSPTADLAMLWNPAGHPHARRRKGPFFTQDVIFKAPITSVRMGNGYSRQRYERLAAGPEAPRGHAALAIASLPAAVIMCTNRLGALDLAIQRRAADILSFARPDDGQRTAILEPLGRLGLSGSQIAAVVKATGASQEGGHDFTFSDLMQWLLPAIVLDAYPDGTVDPDLAILIAQTMIPTEPFRGA